MSINFPKEEERILAFWNSINAFHRQLELSKGKKPYTFYDGPPFATGMPHVRCNPMQSAVLTFIVRPPAHVDGQGHHTPLPLHARSPRRAQVWLGYAWRSH